MVQSGFKLVGSARWQFVRWFLGGDQSAVRSSERRCWWESDFFLIVWFSGYLRRQFVAAFAGRYALRNTMFLQKIGFLTSSLLLP